jgi:hypothetical protein
MVHKKVITLYLVLVMEFAVESNHFFQDTGIAETFRAIGMCPSFAVKLRARHGYLMRLTRCIPWLISALKPV